MNKFLLGILACAVLALQAMAADPVALRSDHPDEYVVKRGDTLWDISGRFLEKPWLWPEIWQVNPQIANPHLIYPGDRLSLIYVDGRPWLALNRGVGGVVKLSPEVRSSALDNAIPAIPLEEINAFLTRSRIVGSTELDEAPYVLAGAGGHVVTGAGDNLYARGGSFPPGERSFGIFRAEVLGKEAVEIGAVKMTDLESGMATLAVNKSNEEIRAGDRLLPMVEQKITATFFPSAPESEISGVILAVEGGVTQIGHLDVVAINRGAREGLKEGNVLEISKRGGMVNDPVTNEAVQLPATRAGLLMVFRTFEKMSYGLILHATQPLAVMDTVANP